MSIPASGAIIAYHIEASETIELSEELVGYRLGYWLVAPEKLRPWQLGTGLSMADWMRSRGLPVEFIELPNRAQLDPTA